MRRLRSININSAAAFESSDQLTRPQIKLRSQTKAADTDYHILSLLRKTPLINKCQLVE